MPYRSIDTDRAEALYKFYGSWRLVGMQMAQDEGRETIYQSKSVENAVARARKQREKQNGAVS